MAFTMMACTSNPPPNPGAQADATSAEVVLHPAPSSTATPATNPTVAPAAVDLADDTPVREGYVSFSGMVLPVKGGYEVRGVVFSELFAQRLTDSSVDGKPADPDWFLGAIVRVTAELASAQTPMPLTHDRELAVQTSSGSSLRVVRLDTVELVENASTIEGTLTRSKGLFQVDRYLVRESDLDWSLVGSGGPKEGMRVKLWGQPRIIRCKPGAQCLTTGSLPMFRVARAQRL